jgi:catechol-2,3-dioxygenase
MAPQLGQVVESVLYASEATKLGGWYKDVMGLEPFLENAALSAFSLPNNTILLIFSRDMVTEDRVVNGGVIPKHGSPTGLGQHIAFGCAGPEVIAEWEKHFQEKGVEIIARMDWELGGKSIYVHDSEGHVIEIMTTGVWTVY